MNSLHYLADVFGALGLVGSAIAILRGSIASNTIKLLQQNNEALHETNARQEEDISVLRRKLDTQGHIISHLEDMVSGRQVLDALVITMEDHHKAVMSALGRSRAG